MRGQRILGRKTASGVSRGLGILIAVAPLMLTGCWPDGQDAARRDGETITPIQQTSEQIVRAGKSGLLRPVWRKDRLAKAPPPKPVPTPAPAFEVEERAPEPPAGTIGPAPAGPQGPLARFHQALYDIENGVRREPVTILHLGDSHIASDRLTGDVRDMLQARFGDAGRGLMMPGFPFAYYRARGVKFSRRGGWKAANSFRGAKGPFGVTGVSLTTRQKGARLSLASTSGPFEWAEASFLTGPGHGSAVVAVDSQAKAVETQAAEPGIRRVRIDHKGSALRIRARGDGPVTVLSWAIGHNRPGIRYVNLGIPGATADITRRWDEDFVRNDIVNLKPDLIVLGFGTNEGFNDRLNIDGYEKRYAELVTRLRAAAPNASLAVIGPPDSARLPRRFGSAGRGTAGCKPLNDSERRNYATLKRTGSRTLARWHAPPKLAGVRSALERVASENKAHYWNWREAMGGDCAVHEWAKAEPQLAVSDHVHITARGSLRSAHAFYASLMAGYGASRQVASRAGGVLTERQVR